MMSLGLASVEWVLHRGERVGVSSAGKETYLCLRWRALPGPATCWWREVSLLLGEPPAPEPHEAPPAAASPA